MYNSVRSSSPSCSLFFSPTRRWRTQPARSPCSPSPGWGSHNLPHDPKFLCQLLLLNLLQSIFFEYFRHSGLVKNSFFPFILLHNLPFWSLPLAFLSPKEHNLSGFLQDNRQAISPPSIPSFQSFRTITVPPSIFFSPFLAGSPFPSGCPGPLLAMSVWGAKTIAQCAFWVVRWPSSQKLKSKNTLSDGKKYFWGYVSYVVLGRKL